MVFMFIYLGLIQSSKLKGVNLVVQITIDKAIVLPVSIIPIFGKSAERKNEFLATTVEVNPLNLSLVFPYESASSPINTGYF